MPPQCPVQATFIPPVTKLAIPGPEPPLGPAATSASTFNALQPGSHLPASTSRGQTGCQLSPAFEALVTGSLLPLQPPDSLTHPALLSPATRLHTCSFSARLTLLHT